MGSFISKGMSGAMEKMQEQQQTMMERQILLQNEMRQRGVATQIAFTREMFMWLGSFYVIATTGAILGFLKTKKSASLVPILPLTFIVGYQADLAYGDKITRVRAEAENIMKNEGSILNLPNGLPTIQKIDELRKNK
ncbi:plasminogen receptor (KT)-like isoform X2 [Xenia sp. Carnegie-2017]|uniref:plasminogen receptor (KT)-like isoform X2 n=2 Tax=Xenia sp. Carnegie-2017 TaxID=2897299 RepID=UPI001F035B82|nr:plasminogen receptor (KT)-like isoform X2 [Xenia sp. Carnegie-2017]XP_046843613.1 plasminogen receptor (KT)-like isoform X2 [Xenia sp. Carnegie-2017]XP_046843618.1 plasminogen receptor (KT)-like isoform X2 [Xenia sp. Carnegie-2017]